MEVLMSAVFLDCNWDQNTTHMALCKYYSIYLNIIQLT